MRGRCKGSARLLGVVVRYRGGPDIGPVTGAFVDASSGRSEWVVVRTERLLPVRSAHVAPDGRLVVALPDLAVELSPPLRSGTAALNVRDEDRLHGHYAAVLGRARDGAPGGVPFVVGDDPGSAGTPRATRAAPPAGPAASGPHHRGSC